MAERGKRRTGAQKTADWRARKRAQGLRMVQLWVPDMRRPEVAASLRRQAERFTAQAEDRQALSELEPAIAELWGRLD